MVQRDTERHVWSSTVQYSPKTQRDAYGLAWSSMVQRDAEECIYLVRSRKTQRAAERCRDMRTVQHCP